MSHSEILLFGGFDSSAKEVKKGEVMMCLDGSHSYLEQPVDLTIVDSFSNCVMVHTKKGGKSVLVQGKHAVHRLDISNPAKRTFSIAFHH